VWLLRGHAKARATSASAAHSDHESQRCCRCATRVPMPALLDSTIVHRCCFCSPLVHTAGVCPARTQRPTDASSATAPCTAVVCVVISPHCDDDI